MIRIKWWLSITESENTDQKSFGHKSKEDLTFDVQPSSIDRASKKTLSKVSRRPSTNIQPPYSQDLDF